MGRKRKSTGTRLRMEILKRDGFRCIYCGATPFQTLLHVDHVVPVAKGGTDDPANLVTACHECNAGKSDIPLEERRIPQGMNIEEKKEHLAQVTEYLKLQKGLSSQRTEAAKFIGEHWEKHIGSLQDDMLNRLEIEVARVPFETLSKAIEITGLRKGKAGHVYASYVDQQKYFYGVLRKQRIRDAGGDPFVPSPHPPPPPPPAPKPPEPKWSWRAQHVYAQLRAEQKKLIELKCNFMEEICEVFGLLAYARPEELERIEWDPDYPIVRARGLALVAEEREDKMLYWHVEDDPYWSVSLEIDILSDADLIPLGRAIDAENFRAARTEFDHYRWEHRERAAFICYCMKTEVKAEEYLRKVRDDLGWPNPPQLKPS